MVKPSEPIVLEAGRLVLKVQYRTTRDDEGITIDVLAAEGATRLLRFDCFKKVPHAHFGRTVIDMKKEAIPDPLRWTLAQLKTELREMIHKAGYAEIADSVNPQAVTQAIFEIEKQLRP